MSALPELVVRLDPAAARRARLRGAGLFVCALCLLATLDALAKHLVQHYPAPFLNIVRYLVVFALACALMLHARIPLAWRMPARGLLLARGLMLGLVGTCFMTALHVMPLAEATAIYFVSPLIIVAASPWLLGERVGARQWLAVLAGFAGMLLIVRPGNDLPLVGTLLMAGAALAYALLQLFTRRLAGRAHPRVQFFYAAAVCVLVTALPAPFFLPEVWPGPGDALLIGLVGALSAGGQYLLIRAFQQVAASTLAPLNYLHLALAVVFSTAWFGQRPDPLSLAGIAVIAAAGLSLLRPSPAALATGPTTEETR